MSRQNRPVEYGIIIAVMALMGGYFWAIRGTTGYGGETGGMLAGFGWALLWYFFSHTGTDAPYRPYGHLWILPAITFGIALGGLTGYGVYTAWVRGDFFLNHPQEPRPVGAWTGYAMLFLCGLHWGGKTGCFMAWCAPRTPLRYRDWAVRLAYGLAGAGLTALWVRITPQWFLPFYNEGIYAVPENKTCIRSLLSLQTIAPHIGLLLGFLAYECRRGDRRAVAMILTMAMGFALPFSLGGYWHTFDSSTLPIDWWKNWEMTIGLGGGAAFGLAWYWFNRPASAKAHEPKPWIRQCFRYGVPLYPAWCMVFKGAYEGWCEMGMKDPHLFGYILIAIVSAIPSIAAFLLDRKKAEGLLLLSGKAILLYQIIIILMGLSVSFPRDWRFANTILILCYAGYIGTSLLLLAWYRSLQRNLSTKESNP